MVNKTFLLEVPEEIWNSFKGKINKSTSINEKIVSLLERYRGDFYE